MNLADFEVTNLSHSPGREEEDTSSTLFSLSNGRIIVIDFWTTKCVKCPSVIEKLNNMTSTYPEIFFASCVLNDKEVAADIIEESEWGNMTHLYIEPAVKDALKSQFGFSEVPFCLVIDESHTVIASGNPKNMNLDDILKSLKESPNTATSTLSSSIFSSDDF